MHNLNVLIVDDSKAMLGIAEATLHEVGIEKCTCVQSGKDALSAIHHASPPFDLLFIDLNMPGMDGIELIRKLSTSRYEGAVVILSALDEKILLLAEQITSSLRIRLMGSISKPIDREKVKTILQKMKTMRSIYQTQYSQLNKSEINNALKNNLLTPYYQPKVSTNNGKVESLEILARINSPLQTNAITPDQFIPSAEKLNLIEPLTYNLLNRVLEDLPQLTEEFGTDCRLAINISPNSLHDLHLPEMLAGILEQKGIPTHRLILEITENIPIEHPSQLETLGRLRIKGFELALDDFGTGFTNIQQLKSLPFNEIKLDRSLIYNIAHDHISQVIVQSLLKNFDETQVDVVAEGIDNAEDLNYLNALSYPLMLQGYIISKPKNADDICRWHHSWKKTIEDQL